MLPIDRASISIPESGCDRLITILCFSAFLIFTESRGQACLGSVSSFEGDDADIPDDESSEFAAKVVGEENRDVDRAA
jgi:hypothetical protein